MRHTAGRRLALGVATLAALGATALAGPASAGTRSVRVGDNYFVRPSGVPALSVKRGDTVRWVWRGRAAHNVTVAKGPVRFKSRTQSSGSFSKSLTRRGTYRLICTIHGPRDQSMILRVR
jgi:plastocyanin